MPTPSRLGSRRSEIDYSIIGAGANSCPSWSRRSRPGTRRISPGWALGTVQLYRSQGHLLEVTDLVDKMQQVPGGLFPVSSTSVMHQGKAYGVPQSVSPWPLVTRLDLLEAAKVEPLRRGTSSSRSVRSCKSRPSSPAMACVSA